MKKVKKWGIWDKESKTFALKFATVNSLHPEQAKMAAETVLLALNEVKPVYEVREIPVCPTCGQDVLEEPAEPSAPR